MLDARKNFEPSPRWQQRMAPIGPANLTYRTFSRFSETSLPRRSDRADPNQNLPLY